jgi:hypothetical protein
VQISEQGNTVGQFDENIVAEIELHQLLEVADVLGDELQVVDADVQHLGNIQ